MPLREAIVEASEDERWPTVTIVVARLTARVRRADSLRHCTAIADRAKTIASAGVWDAFASLSTKFYAAARLDGAHVADG